MTTLREEEIEFGKPTPELKEYMAEVNEKRKNERFNKQPKWLVKSGVIAVLRPETVKVLAVLIYWADFRRLIGRVGNERIARESRVQGVSICIKELKDWGVIKVWKKAWRRYYQIQLAPPKDINLKVEAFRKKQLNKCPLSSDTYSRDPKTGRFTKK